MAKECGIKPKSAGEVKDEIGIVSPGEAFKYICNGLERQVPNLPTLYDVILIDEGQDLPDSFYRLAYGTLCPPKRLYWAYDEAQSIDSLMVRRSCQNFWTQR